MLRSCDFGHDEIAPGLTHGQFAGIVATRALGAIVAWEYLRLVFDDPLYLGGSALTLVSYALFGPALFLRRRGGFGQSRLMWLCFTAMSATWWAATAMCLTPAVRSWQYLGAGGFCVVVGVVMLKALSVDRISKRTPVCSEPDERFAAGGR